MKLLLFLWSYVVAIAKAVGYGWILALIAIWHKLREIVKEWLQRRALPGRARRASESDCNPIAEPAFKRPDPLIYSQGELMKLGLAVTWDNPDIVLRKNGVTVPSSALDPATEYEVEARIWNNSTNAPIVALPVRFSYLSFGIGVESHPIGLTAVDVGVKGGPGHPAFARTKWTSPAVAGHYCLQVRLEPADDLNFENNLGQENTVVGEVQSPADFTFLLRNASPEDEVFHFEVDTYRIPQLPPCGQVASPSRHERRSYPILAGWSLDIAPSEPRLGPGQETTVQVRITAPAGFHGRQPFNVNAFDRRGFAGGVTLYVNAA
jgi:hypothetical protein